MDEKEIEQIKKKILSDNSLVKLSSFYSLFADPTRLALISLLSENSLCVNDIATVMGMSQSRVSHQLAILRQQDIVTYYRQGKQIHYTLSDNHIKSLFKTGLEHVSEKDADIFKERSEKDI